DRALRQEFPAEADAGRAASVSEGDMARQALLLLADDPQNRDALAALIAGPPPESFEVVGTVALVAATLVVLQTHVLFERDRDGKIHIKIEKKPTRDSLLKDLVQKLFGFFPANYHQLGMIAQERRDFASAEQWYRKALAIEEKQGDEHGDESVAFAPESRGIDVEDAT